jgi:hypothetical protein
MSNNMRTSAPSLFLEPQNTFLNLQFRPIQSYPTQM